jgi:hypothetical protein
LVDFQANTHESWRNLVGIGKTASNEVSGPRNESASGNYVQQKSVSTLKRRVAFERGYVDGCRFTG